MLIENLIVALGFRSDRFEKGIDRSKQKLTAFDKGLKATTSILKGWAIALIASATAAIGFTVIVNHLRQAIEDLDKLGATSSELGISPEFLSGLQYMAIFVDLPVDQFNDSLKTMVKNIGLASMGAGRAVDALKALNLNITKLATMSPEEQVKAIANGLKQVGNYGTRATLAMRIFGSSGGKIAAMLKDGEEGIAAMMKEAEKLGLIFTSNQVAMISLVTDKFDVLKSQLEAVFKQLAVRLAPALILITNKISLMLQQMVKIADVTRLLNRATGAWAMGFVAELAILSTMLEILVLNLELIAITIMNLGSLNFNLLEGSDEVLRALTEANARLGSLFIGDWSLNLERELNEIIRNLRNATQDQFPTDELPDFEGEATKQVPAALERGSSAAFEKIAELGGTNLRVAEINNTILGHIIDMVRGNRATNQWLSTIANSIGLSAPIP